MGSKANSKRKAKEFKFVTIISQLHSLCFRYRRARTIGGHSQSVRCSQFSNWRERDGAH